MALRELSLTINGEAWSGIVDESEFLCDFLRIRLGLVGTKVSCEQQVCGSCTVLIDGHPVSSCAFLAFEADGQRIETVESTSRELAMLRQAFVEFGAIQCGFCTPGQLTNAVSYVRRCIDDPGQDSPAWDAAFDGNLCRCGTYPAIREAVRWTIRELDGPSPGD